MVGWVGKLVGIQLSAFVGTVGAVALVAWLLPFGVVGTMAVGILVSGSVFFLAAYRLIDWESVSSDLDHSIEL